MSGERIRRKTAIDDVLVSVLISLLIAALWSAPGRATQTPDAPSTATAWGEPAQGLALHVELPPGAWPTLPGTLPEFALQIRNRGSATVTFDLGVVYPYVEIDGTWCTDAVAMSGSPLPVTVMPGGESRVVRVRFDLPQRCAVRPGVHTIRLKAWDGRIALSIRRTVTPISNALSVTIPLMTPDDERRELTAQVASASPYFWAAADRLVEKFPDAALTVIETAVRTTADIGRRAGLVRRAGDIPGLPTIAFLESQLATDADLAANIAAAQALQSRGQRQWIPGMIQRWQEIRERAPLTERDVWAETELIELLAGSGDDSGIRALIADPQMPVYLRMAAVVVFLPPDWTDTRIERGQGPDIALMTRPAIDRRDETAVLDVLRYALDDTGRSSGLVATINGLTARNPRVSDFAAAVMSARFPKRYAFRWANDVRVRDRQIETLRKALLR